MVIISMKNEKMLEEIIQKVCDENETNLYDWVLKGNLGNQTLVVFITQNENVSLADCQNISGKLSDELDMRDVFDSQYTLEVSSPGLSRKLTKFKHFVGAVGEVVSIKYLNGDDNLKNVKGKLKSANEDILLVCDRNKDVKINYQKIKKATTIFKWSSKSSNKMKNK